MRASEHLKFRNEKLWYFLLDWRDNNMDTFIAITSKQSLSDLNNTEFCNLMAHIANSATLDSNVGLKTMKYPLVY